MGVHDVDTLRLIEADEPPHGRPVDGADAIQAEPAHIGGDGSVEHARRRPRRAEETVEAIPRQQIGDIDGDPLLPTGLQPVRHLHHPQAAGFGLRAVLRRRPRIRRGGHSDHHCPSPPAVSERTPAGVSATIIRLAPPSVFASSHGLSFATTARNGRRTRALMDECPDGAVKPSVYLIVEDSETGKCQQVERLDTVQENHVPRVTDLVMKEITEGDVDRVVERHVQPQQATVLRDLFQEVDRIGDVFDDVEQRHQIDELVGVREIPTDELDAVGARQISDVRGHVISGCLLKIEPGFPQPRGDQARRHTRSGPEVDIRSNGHLPGCNRRCQQAQKLFGLEPRIGGVPHRIFEVRTLQLKGADHR